MLTVELNFTEPGAPECDCGCVAKVYQSDGREADDMDSLSVMVDCVQSHDKADVVIAQATVRGSCSSDTLALTLPVYHLFFILQLLAIPQLA